MRNQRCPPRILQGYCKDTARILQGYCKDTARILQGYCKDIGIRKLELVASVEFLCRIRQQINTN